MTRVIGLGLVVCAIACGPSGRGGGGGGDAQTGPRIEVAPPDVMVTVVDGVAVMQPYTATLVQVDGSRTDVTNVAAFSLADSAYGGWNGSALTITGGGAGPTRVIATDGNVQGDTGLTVNVKGSRFDGTGVPPNAPDLFGTAVDTPGHAPALAYPADGVLVPPNLGEFDVHWTDSTGNNLYEISLQNQYVDLRIYTAMAAPGYTAYLPNEWASLASPREQLTLAVAGLNTSSPTIKGTSSPQHVDVTNEIVQGGLYYWTTTSPQAVFRYDMSTPQVPPSNFFMGGTQPTSCLGCHTLSKDGTKVAITLDSGDGRGTVFNVADYTVLVPYATNAQYWNFATFNPDASKLVTVSQGQMVLRDSNGGTVLGSLANSAGTLATHPELSPDGTMLANVETTGGGTDYDVTGGSIVLRSFDTTTNAFGPTHTLVADAAGASNFYPSWSPDGQWILFTRNSGNSYDNPTSEIWVVKADGSSAPIQLATADTGMASITNSWGRWTPFPQSSGAANEALFYFTFSTKRAFGVRGTTTGAYGTDTQIWMAPFFPDRATGAMDPSGPAFRMPMQDFNTSNHIAQWTQAVVIGRKADGTPLTQAEAYAK